MQTFLWMLRHPRKAWRGVVTMRALELRTAREWEEARQYWEDWKKQQREREHRSVGE